MSRAYESTTSFYAAEGSVAHALAEQMLKQGDDASGLAGSVVEYEGHKITVTEEMQDSIELFLDVVAPWFDGADFDGLEIRVQVHSAPEGAELFGTLDAGAIQGDTLFIGDFKFGKGVPVGINWNSQLMFYAIALYETLMDESADLIKNVTKVHLCVVQPRIDGGSEPRIWEIDLIDLLMWRDEELMPAVQRIMDGDETLAEGKWCRFCPAIAGCPLKHANAVEAAKLQFEHNSNSDIPSPTQVGINLALARGVVEWMRYLEKEVARLLRSGEDVPGWKIVEGRANRAWAGDSGDMLREIIRRSGAGERADELVKVPELRSPAQVEKALKRWGKKPEFVLDGLVVKPHGKPTLAPATDKRPAVTVSADAQFEEWTDNEETI